MNETRRKRTQNSRTDTACRRAKGTAALFVAEENEEKEEEEEEEEEQTRNS
jgi:hypothetical protein